MPTAKKYTSKKKHTKKRSGGLSTVKRLVECNPEIHMWVSSQCEPGAGLLKRLTTYTINTTFLLFRDLLKKVVDKANELRSQGYKVVDIQGSTMKPFTVVEDTQKPRAKGNFLQDYVKNVFYRTTEFTVYYRKYKSSQEPLAKPLHYHTKTFMYGEKERMRKHIASFMTKHHVLCHVDINDTGALQDTLYSRKGDVNMVGTRVILFYYRE